MKKGDHLFLVDGSGYIFRAYHALPPLSRKSDGLPVGAVAGFCNMLWKLLKNARDTDVGVTPTHFAVIFDYSSKTFRNALYGEYKANRTAPPEDLVPQFGLIREATRAFDLPCIEMEGFEADDLIATYARLACEAGADTTIISSDKDLMQLVGATTQMYDPMKDKQIGVPEVIEKWGVPPEKMIDLQALTGDSIDNVPGVPGIGPKTAAQLLEEFGDLDTLLMRASEIKQNKRRENIIQHADNARLSRELVKLRNDAPIVEQLDELVLNPLDGPKLIAFLKAMEFTTLTKRVAEATEADASAIEAKSIAVEWGEDAHGPDVGAGATTQDTAQRGPLTPADLVAKRADAVKKLAKEPVDHTIIRGSQVLADWIAAATESGTLAFDILASSADPMKAEIVGLTLALENGICAYIPVGHHSGDSDLLGGGLAEEQISEGDALSLLKPLLEDASVLKIGHDAKFDYVMLAQRGVTLSPPDDIQLLSYVLDSGTGAHSLEALAARWLDKTLSVLKELTGTGRSAVPVEQTSMVAAANYASDLVHATLAIWRVLKPRLAAEGMTSVYERLERPLIAALGAMEQRGIEIDRQTLSRLSGELAQRAAAFEDEIYEVAGERFNIGSPKQLGDILFGKMGVPGGSKTKTGQWSTSAQVLEELAAEGHELPRKIVDWRQLTKLKSTYTDALPGYIHPRTRRVHTSYAMAATSTGRLSSSEPNLQNIPIRTAEGRKIRTAFIAPAGRKLISADYSQIELRVLAHVADIPQLRQAFSDGVDIHAMTASEMFSVPVEGMPTEIRRRAKAINFGIIYGISAFGLANQLSIPREEASDYIKRYFERFPGIRDYMESTKNFCRENGYVETIFGRRAHYPDIKASNPQIRAFNERAAINAPIQGSAADIIRRAMVQMDAALQAAKVKADMLLQVHDELIFEVDDAEAEKAIPVIRQTMESAAMPALSMRVPLHVDARAANSWDEAH
ncbi:DNA polymerase I [Limoniibacter endophyticus]|uniref:DNA polymerase I n=1 Tax=Limoniibacter endophyticus TaxID=1565040 RepID=A0A8J3DK58_9HYPH|nr:DNA polymerase I [Limoniibacter endophyticus]GHC80248.1 DNA polymerase I [Limoniibacter endophyticus]